MARGDTWSVEEVEATVAAYLRMLHLELARTPYSKAHHRRALVSTLDGRTEGSVERKFGNISAVLIELGYPYVVGYKPYSHYQSHLADVVASRVGRDPSIDRMVAQRVDSDALPAEIDDPLSLLTATPKPTRVGVVRMPPRDYEPRKVDYLAREARNQSLGRAGELLVLSYERARLHRAGAPGLAERVEHVSETRGDGLGYDVHSFEDDGADRLIEVKTTRFGDQTPFFVSRNELAVSRDVGERYHLYRPFTFDTQPRLFIVTGPLDRNFDLDPEIYRARLA